ncbi:unnamed protein product, partial [Heterotrigona itama]
MFYVSRNFSRRSLPPWDFQWYLLDESLHDNFSYSIAASMTMFSTSITSGFSDLIRSVFIVWISFTCPDVTWVKDIGHNDH